MQNLTLLRLSGNDLRGDLAALAPLTSLTRLGLRQGGPGRGGLVGNLSFAEGMPNLTRLSIVKQQLSGGLGPLQNLDKLEYFSAGDNDLSGDLGPLQNLTTLSHFSAGGNRLSGDLSSVPKSLKVLWLDGNEISGLGSGFNSSGVQILSLGRNIVKANAVDIIQDLPRTVLYLNMSKNKELQGDIVDLVSDVSSKTSILDLHLTDTGLTSRTNSSSIVYWTGLANVVQFFRDVTWGTQDMGQCYRSGDVELESENFRMGNLTYESTKERPPSVMNQIGAALVGGAGILLGTR